ncbi:MAG: zincin-like metallopeptidase domain-containing protein [Terrimicrobiaceae bacterium]
MRHNSSFGIMGHSTRLNREGITERVRFGSERYCKEELVGELGAAFLSNEAGILDSVRFENSAAYLASWAEKLAGDPRMIISAASHAQRASDFIKGIEHKESLQECQISPEGMPLTWAREHGIDTRVPGFCSPRPGWRRSFNAYGMEARNQAVRQAFTAATASVYVAMKKVTLHSLAHLRLDGAHWHPSFRRHGRRVLAAPAFGKAAKERTFPDPRAFARPFIPSSPCRPDTWLRAERIGYSTFRVTGRTPQMTHIYSNLIDQARISEVIQDSDFRTEIASRKEPCFSAVPPCVRRTTGDFAPPHRFHLHQSNT